MNYEAVIGLEVHLHLKTRSKAFCGCSTEFGKEPNAQTCPVCLGFPGSLPVLNRQALDYAIKTGIALNCKIQEFTKFDRKNYFYPDLPKNYQISQYDFPLATGGFLDIEIEGKTKRIGITRAHLEEDAGKLIHKAEMSLVDFNRAGVPLLEIVTQPDINSPLEAYEYLTLLKTTLEYLEVSDCDMEKGSLRCDANVSVRKIGDKVLGTKAELKNMNSFKGVKDALEFEIQRQIGLLESGEKIIQETRLWDTKELKTIPMRSKEEAKDYRYFPEPDLPPFMIKKEQVEAIRKTIPELPKEKMSRFVKEYELSENYAKTLTNSKSTAVYAEACFKDFSSGDKKIMANWLVGPFASVASDHNCSIADLRISSREAVNLVNFVINGSISNLAGKTVLEEMSSTGKTPAIIIQEKNLSQISDTASLEGVIDEIIKANPKSVGDFKNGKNNALMFLVGQVMKKSQGKANPKVVQDILKGRLGNA